MRVRASAVCLCLLAIVIGCARPAAATSISLGIVSFDTLIPGPDGTNAFTLANLTGDPGLGGFALPPDFPVATFLTFTSPSLGWDSSAGSSSYDFGGGGIGPGFLSDPALEFSDSITFSSGTFTALLSTTTFRLTDGRFFLASSPLITANLTNSFGTLAPGDFVVLSVDAEEISRPVPEPASATLLIVGVAGARFVRRARNAKARSHPRPLVLNS